MDFDANGATDFDLDMDLPKADLPKARPQINLGFVEETYLPTDFNPLLAGNSPILPPTSNTLQSPLETISKSSSNEEIDTSATSKDKSQEQEVPSTGSSLDNQIKQSI